MFVHGLLHIVTFIHCLFVTEWTHRFNQWEGFGAGGFSPTPPLSVGLSIAITQASVSGVARSAIYCIRDSRYQLLVALFGKQSFQVIMCHPFIIAGTDKVSLYTWEFTP